MRSATCPISSSVVGSIQCASSTSRSWSESYAIDSIDGRY
jgi:hypothetical protein